MRTRTLSIIMATAIALVPAMAWSADDSVEDVVATTKTSMQQLASNIVAAAVCQDAQLDSEPVFGLLLRGSFVLGKVRTQEIFLKALRASIEESSANKGEWCRSTITAAVARESAMLSSVQPSK